MVLTLPAPDCFDWSDGEGGGVFPRRLCLFRVLRECRHCVVCVQRREARPRDRSRGLKVERIDLRRQIHLLVTCYWKSCIFLYQYSEWPGPLFLVTFPTLSRHYGTAMLHVVFRTNVSTVPGSAMHVENRPGFFFFPRVERSSHLLRVLTTSAEADHNVQPKNSGCRDGYQRFSGL